MWTNLELLIAERGSSRAQMRPSMRLIQSNKSPLSNPTSIYYTFDNCFAFYLIRKLANSILQTDNHSSVTLFSFSKHPNYAFDISFAFYRIRNFCKFDTSNWQSFMYQVIFVFQTPSLFNFTYSWDNSYIFTWVKSRTWHFLFDLFFAMCVRVVVKNSL